MKYILKEYYRRVPDCELINDLRKTGKRIGKKNVTIDEQLREGKYNPYTIIYRFGTWNDALIKAGLKVYSFKNIPTGELISNMKRVWNSLGRQPKMKEMVKPRSKYGGHAYMRRFGSWSGAIMAFVKLSNNGKLVTMALKNRRIKKIGKKINKNITKGLRYDVLKRDRFKCRLCGRNPADDPKVKLHVDHIVPVAKGGETVIKNLQTLCSDCNLGKATKK